MNTDLENILNQAILEFRTMNHLYHTDYVLNSHGLEFYTTFFQSNNPTHHVPYHNEYHSYCMVLNCYEGARYENVSGSDLRSLLVAALFHDYNHSAGECSDEINIRRAISGLQEAQMHVHTITKYRPLCGDWYAQLTLQEFDKAIDAIKITKYPYEEPPTTLIQKIIRDADLMQVYEENERRLCKQFRGLQEEVERLRKVKYSKEEWANGNVEFNNAVVWHTNWAKRKAVVRDHAACVQKLKQLLVGYK